jgi:hypothetical protein
MGTMPLVGIIQRIGKNEQNNCYNSMNHGEGTCLTSNIGGRVGYKKDFMCWGRVSKYKYELGERD